MDVVWDLAGRGVVKGKREEVAEVADSPGIINIIICFFLLRTKGQRSFWVRQACKERTGAIKRKSKKKVLFQKKLVYYCSPFLTKTVTSK